MLGRVWRGPGLALALLPVLASLFILQGCDSSENSNGAQRGDSWPQTAIVADLSDRDLSIIDDSILAGLKAIGFDTVLLDGHSAPAPTLKLWLDAAKGLKLRTVVQIGAPQDGALEHTDIGGLAQADGLVLTLRHDADLNYAQALRDMQKEQGSTQALIAHIVTASSGVEAAARAATTALFDVVFNDVGGEDLLSQLGPSPLLPTRESPSTKTEHPSGKPRGLGKRAWLRIPHCQQPQDRPCSEDIRQLVLAFTQPPVPVTGIIDTPYWRDVYASLIQLRRENPLTREGDLEWYAPDAVDGVLAYRLSNDARQHIIVAINVSNEHHQLPLPSGFMAVSKIRLWASYDPKIREIVTSKPIVLPARSAVIVIEG